MSHFIVFFFLIHKLNQVQTCIWKEKLWLTHTETFWCSFPSFYRFISVIQFKQEKSSFSNWWWANLKKRLNACTLHLVYSVAITYLFLYYITVSTAQMASFIPLAVSIIRKEVCWSKLPLDIAPLRLFLLAVSTVYLWSVCMCHKYKRICCAIFNCYGRKNGNIKLQQKQQQRYSDTNKVAPTKMK